jgi:hypothetical protein
MNTYGSNALAPNRSLPNPLYELFGKTGDSPRVYAGPSRIKVAMKPTFAVIVTWLLAAREQHHPLQQPAAHDAAAC